MFQINPREFVISNWKINLQKIELIHFVIYSLFLVLYFPFPRLALPEDPEFTDVIENITVPAGRNIKLACSVKNLGTYKVNAGEKKGGMKEIKCCGSGSNADRRSNRLMANDILFQSIQWIKFKLYLR